MPGKHSLLEEPVLPGNSSLPLSLLLQLVGTTEKSKQRAPYLTTGSASGQYALPADCNSQFLPLPLLEE